MVNKEVAACPVCTAPREKTFLLARPEQRLLEAIARRLPAFVRPDHLTVLALAAAVAFAVAAATGRSALAAALLVVHWLGDSLDGTLARVRRAERPRYGYYLDHLADAFATALVGLGLGLSAHMHLAAGLVLVIAYLALSINSYLETQALGRFSLGYGRLGPTEARLALIALLAAVALGAEVSVAGLTLLDLVALGGAAVMVARAGARARAGTCGCWPSASPTPRRSARRAGPPPRTPRACGRTGRRARSPITIDCSSAMIRPGDALVVERATGPSACRRSS